MKIDELLLKQGAMTAKFQTEYKRNVLNSIKKHGFNFDRVRKEIKSKNERLVNKIIKNSFALGEKWLKK